jgi:hypothetical protein
MIWTSGLLQASRIARGRAQCKRFRAKLKRFHYRLAKSKHRDRFVLKGAMLFAADGQASRADCGGPLRLDFSHVGRPAP